nr:retrovirus-related Pol polyprotein from transposon TNT 1-94 [Tanacetum cinerariifolium]
MGASRIVDDQMKNTQKTEHPPMREAPRLHMYEDPSESPRLYYQQERRHHKACGCSGSKKSRITAKGCSKHMTGNLKLLINFVWKFTGTVRFENDYVAAIMGFADLQWGNILITRVYFVEGLGHNLFSVGQFCDSVLEVAFRRNAYFVRNLEGVDLLKGDRSTNLYTINLHEMASASPICLMARASSTKSWLWHQRLSHLNFDTINDIARNDHVAGLPKFKYHKEHLCPLCEQGKSKRASHPPKPVPNSRQRLHLLHMDLCGPMRIASINGKREEKHMPNTVSASARTKPITVSQSHVITKKDVNSDLNGLSSIEVDNTKTRRTQPRSNTKHDRVPSASKSSRCYSDLFMVRRFGLFQAYDRKSKASYQFCLEVYGNCSLWK